MLDLDAETGLRLIAHARQREQNDRLFQQWVVQLPFMGRDSFVSFEQYKDNVTGANIDLRPAGEILAELDDLERQFLKDDVNGA